MSLEGQSDKVKRNLNKLNFCGKVHLYRLVLSTLQEWLNMQFSMQAGDSAYPNYLVFLGSVIRWHNKIPGLLKNFSQNTSQLEYLWAPTPLCILLPTLSFPLSHKSWSPPLSHPIW